MQRTVTLGGVLFVVWLLLSGHFEPLLLGLGVASVVVVLIVARRMEVIDREGHPIHLTWRAIGYWPWLLWEIVKANIDVARVILRPRMPIQPNVFTVPGSQRSELGNVIYANSITLTPGTVTIALESGKLTVHALTRDAAAGVETGEMDRRVSAMEGAAAGTDETIVDKEAL